MQFLLPRNVVIAQAPIIGLETEGLSDYQRRGRASLPLYGGSFARSCSASPKMVSKNSSSRGFALRYVLPLPPGGSAQQAAKVQSSVDSHLGALLPKWQGEGCDPGRHLPLQPNALLFVCDPEF